MKYLIIVMISFFINSSQSRTFSEIFSVIEKRLKTFIWQFQIFKGNTDEQIVEKSFKWDDNNFFRSFLHELIDNMAGGPGFHASSQVFKEIFSI